MVPTALVIVESPAKAKTIAGYLGDDYVVESSIGHVRDLPQGAADVPAAYKGESWARLGIDVDNGFKPLYVVNRDKKDQIKKLKALLKDADELYLATDEDREGEAIAWHLLEVLNPTVPVKRMVFHEITAGAIQEAVDNPRELDRRMVDAQEARRILDRLVGYEVSPVLWKKVMPKLSAGRVQSVATRIVVERERERMAFIRASYWDLNATFAAQGDVPEGEPRDFGATLVEIDGKRIASGKDFAQDGQLKKDDIVVIDEARAGALATNLDGAEFTVTSVEPKPYRRRPSPPFMTSTFQQEAGRKLRMSASMAMRAAQSLYEKGFITYMRTDSPTLSDTAMNAARSFVQEKYGASYLPDGPRVYKGKSKNAQEAHEAIRPAGETFRLPEEVAKEVVKSEADVYEMIFKRTVASQMTDAVGETIAVRLQAETRAADSETVEFAASGTVISHPGFRRVYVEGTDDDAAAADADTRLPPLTVGANVDVRELSADGHETQPPARYTEASLVKRLEELEVGRPSTYASIMGTIQNRGYVWKKGSALIPSFTAFSVVNLLEQHFPNLVDYAFTARMEDDLDRIAAGTEEPIPWLERFYFGDKAATGPDADPGLKEKVDARLGEIDAAAINSIPLGVTEDGEMVIARVGRYGPYVQRGGGPAEGQEATEPWRASIPDDIAPDELTLERAIQYIEAPAGNRELGEHPETGLMVYAKSGRFGDYVQMGEIDDGGEKPKTASLFKSMDLETIDLETAMKLLTLPRVVGVDPADGQEITVANGRYGPYLQKIVVDAEGKQKKDSRTLESEEQLLTITVEECLKVLAQPKTRRGQTVKPPLKEMGLDPVTEKNMVVKDGRWGPYVTDGETNASLRKGDTVEELTVERASELLAERRAKGPAKKKKATKKKATKKKATKKKAPAKKAAASSSEETPETAPTEAPPAED
ncbi:MAG: type I DNA topoisomerase [Acidimicrobiales bacterium]|nr:type I DNA topoisomerase [Acidimicrobiales bacterium]